MRPRITKIQEIEIVSVCDLVMMPNDPKMLCLNSYVQSDVLYDDQKNYFPSRNADFGTILSPHPWKKLEIRSIRIIHVSNVNHSN